MAVSLRATWGVSSNSTAVGVYTDVSQGCEPILAPLHDEIGRVIGQAHYDSHNSGEYTILCKANVNLPKVGTKITIGDTTGYVTSVRMLENNQSYQRASVTIEAYLLCNETTIVNENEPTIVNEQGA